MTLQELPDELIIRVGGETYRMIRTVNNYWFYFHEKTSLDEQTNSISKIKGEELVYKINEGSHNVIGVVKEETRTVPKNHTFVKCRMSGKMVIIRQPNIRNQNACFHNIDGFF